jgi:hypothetical protein
VICERRQFLETRLRAHYPNLRNGDSLFPEFDSQNFTAIGHRGYMRLLHELGALQNRLYDCTKFDKLIRYRCANLFFLVLPELILARRPVWHETREEDRIRLLHRIALAGTRALNRKLHNPGMLMQAVLDGHK